MRFNAKKLIDDCGGVREVAELLGKPRTAPYRMMSTRYMTTWHFEELKKANPSLNIDDYFEDNNEPETEKFKDALYNEACHALDRGWTIIPLSIKGKMPLAEWKHKQTEPTTIEEVEDWFENGAPTKAGGRVEFFNLALITGSISGVIVLDCDNEDAVAYAKKHNLQSPIAVKTTRGYHYYFKHPQHGKRFANKVGGVARDWVDVPD